MTPQTLELVEYTPLRLDQNTLPAGLGDLIWRRYGRQVAVDFPSPRTGFGWQFTALGWIGLLPVSPALTLVLRPKVPLRQLWSMLAYAFDLEPLYIGDRLLQAAALPDLYERLAALLAQRVLTRCRRGLHRAYLPVTERLTTVRGRIDPAATLRTPVSPALVCHHEVQTVDIVDNQLLLWTLERILRSGACSPAVRPLVQRAFRALAAVVTLRPLPADAARHRAYHRLNADYRPLHALCAFFLEQLTPLPEEGEHAMLPFALPMARLYERFVAAWLTRHLPSHWSITAQERHPLDEAGHFSFTIDLVLRDRASGAIWGVLDTKYRSPGHRPSADELAQIIAYAGAAGANQAILVFPAQVDPPLDLHVNGVRVRSLTFALDRNLAEAGQEFLHALSN
jgi:5-methylcytosine-specific restriction enzyme subunit McrC